MVPNAKGACLGILLNPKWFSLVHRCTRLNKDCQPSEAIRQRKATSKKPASKVDRLEQKLDGLVTLLQSTPQTRETLPSIATVQDQLTPESLQSFAPTPADNDSRQVLPVDKERDSRYCPGTGLSINVPVISPETVYSISGTRSTTYHGPDTTRASMDFEPSINQAEAYLRNYQEVKHPYFPLIILPACVDAQQLRQDRPFLWLCIMAISSKSSDQQKALGREIRLTVGREILLEGKNNLDLLLGLIIYTAWYV